MHHTFRKLAAPPLLAATLIAVPTGTIAAADEATAYMLARYTPPDGHLDPVLAALAAGRIGTDVPPLDPGQIVPRPVRTGYVIQGSELDGFDIADTAIGKAEIVAHVDSLRERGELRAAAMPYRVFSLPDVDADPDDITHILPIDTGPVDALSEDEGPLSSSIVVPSCITPELVGALIDDNGGLFVKSLFSTAPMAAAALPRYDGAQVACDIPSVVEIAGIDPGDQDEWTPAGGIGCPKRKQNNTAWYDVCSWWYHRTDDGIADRDTYGLKQYGTGKSKSTWTLDSLEVQSWRKEGTADQDWMDWSPRSDSDYGNCSSDTLGVNVKAAYLEHTTTHCEKWDIHKGAEPADFANRWDGWVRRSERDTAMIIATNVPNGHVPTDYVDFDYYAW